VTSALALVLCIIAIAASSLIVARGRVTPADDPRAFHGYTLVAPLQSTKTYLIDMRGQVVRTWVSDYTAGQDAYLLENGHLLRPGQLASDEQLFAGAGSGGRVQEFSWEGELVWDFKFHNERQIPHHDLARMPNGNVLLIVWEIKTAEESIAAGRSPDLVEGPWLVDCVLEIKPAGTTSGEVVWEWHAWDHLIQDREPSRSNHGDVAAHPELIDINFGQDHFLAFPRAARSPLDDARKKDNLKALRSLGYVGSPASREKEGVLPEWTHVNAVAYHPERDEIMLTARSFNELWIIDHSTTSEEAAGHTGGRRGKGGDLLYRWGNPQAYRAGTAADQRLFAPHDAHWVPPGRPGAGGVLVFNNGVGRPGRDYSSVDELSLPLDATGRYMREPGAAYGPQEPLASYTAPNKVDFSVPLMGGAQRLPNGNTLVCDSMTGTIFEVTPGKDVVWSYTYPGEHKDGEGESNSSAAGLGLPPGVIPLSSLGKSVFRAYRYAPDYAGLAGKNLTPGKALP
jgi:Arylsulfotransferase (ASST)